ncbi:hypothetical protein ACR9E3_15285 [Actinomycetospora sp. C-140]
MTSIAGDEQVADWLDDVLVRLRASGLADLLERTVARVWEHNVDRYDPAVAGDTAMSLGITAAENIRTLLLREDARTWAARDVVIALEEHALVLHVESLEVLVMKFPGSWDATRWEVASDVRRRAAQDNAASYEPDLDHQPGQTWLLGVGDDDPAELRHLVLAWTGDPLTATTSGWLAVPYAGPPGTTPWLAVTPVWRHGLEDVPRPREPVVAIPRARPPSEPDRASWRACG